MSSHPAPDAERLLTFEAGATVYALPIAEIHEVAEVERICCVPTLPRDAVGVVNWHGDALPVVAPSLLFGDVPEAAGESEDDEEAIDVGSAEVPASAAVLAVEHVLVVSARADGSAQLGVPIDRVIGLVDGPRNLRGGRKLVVERRPVDGRVVNVLCPRRLVARANEVIEREVG